MRISVLAIILFFSLHSLSQTSTISGIVINSINNQPIEFAKIQLVGLSKGAITDSTGSYSIGEIDPGVYSLKASSAGFVDFIVSDITISTSRTTQINFELEEFVLDKAEVIVTAKQFRKIKESPLSLKTLNSTEIEKLPGANRDVSKVLQALPGVASPASFRNDISHQNDLAEELARVLGYDNLPINSIKLSKKSKKLNFSNEEKLKFFLIDNGFIEVINSPFCLANSKNSIKVDNPLDSNREFIRTNIIDSLIENLIYNEKRQQDSIKLFEISDIYVSSSDIPHKKIAIIISGRKGRNYLDFSKKLGKKYLINLFNQIDIDIEKFISIIDRGRLDSKSKNPIFALELSMDALSLNVDDFEPIKKTFSDFTKYKPISEYPSSYRDLSFSVKDHSKLEEVKYALSNAKLEFLKDSYLFDFFENKKTNEIKIGYRFIFQSHKKTLTDEEINSSIKKIIKSVLCINSVSLPGN